MIRKIPNLEFVLCLDFEIINSLPNDGTNYLIIFDDSCDEITKTKEFEKIATAGRHKKVNCIYVKHNLFHKSPIGRDAELQNTHIVLFKSPRDVQQIGVLAKQLGLGKQLVDWYNASTRTSYGHLMIDLRPRTPDGLRFCTDSTSFPATFFLPNSSARITEIDDQQTKLLYSEAFHRTRTKPTENCPPKLFQGTD